MSATTEVLHHEPEPMTPPAMFEAPAMPEGPDITPGAWTAIQITLGLGILYLAILGGYIAWGFFRFQNCKPGF